MTEAELRKIAEYVDEIVYGLHEFDYRGPSGACVHPPPAPTTPEILHTQSSASGGRFRYQVKASVSIATSAMPRHIHA